MRKEFTVPRIAILDFEAKVQLGDKTRLDAAKSFVTKDIKDEITGIKIAPGSQAAIDVIDEDPRKWFLDWLWTDWKWDIDSSFDQLYFVEAGVEKVASVPAGEYSLATLLTAIAGAMTAAGDQAYTVTKNLRNEITVSAPGKFSLLVRNKDAALLSILGFELDSDKDDVSFKGVRVETSRRKVEVTVETTQVVGEKDDAENAETDDIVTGESKTFYVELFTPESDYLFSSDQDLLAEEPDVMKWTVKGRSTHLNVHRKAQQHVVDWLDRNGYRDESGNALTKWNITDVGQVRLWSSYLALKFIFSSISNAVDDVFAEKSAEYEKLEVMARNRAVLELAFTTESELKGKTDRDLSPSSWGGTLVRR